MQAVMTRQQAIAAEHMLVAHLHLARSHAVAHNKEVVLCPSHDHRRCNRDGNWSNDWLLFVDNDGNRRPDQPLDIIRAENTPTPARLRLVSSPRRNFVRFLPDGRSAGTNLTVSICSEDGALLTQVVVNNAGRSRSQRPKKPGNCPR